MTAYYNEIDPVAAQWLRNNIADGLIAPGEVDERDIRDVAPRELVGFTQCHFFAGIGIWSLALRAAGWPDDRPIWTGSCPCQPFSASGRGERDADERHLWPHWFQLIAVCGPSVVAGEQVASKDGLWWFDLVSDDLGAAGYANGALDICAAGFGMGWRGSAYDERVERALHDCPDPMVRRQLRNFADWSRENLGIGGFHARQRLYFVALVDSEGRGCGIGGDAALAGPSGHADGGSDAPLGLADRTGQGSGAGLRGGDARGNGRLDAPDDRPAVELGQPEHPRLEGYGRDQGSGQREDQGRSGAEAGDAGQLVDPDGGNASAERQQPSGQHGLAEDHRGGSGPRGEGSGGDPDRRLGTNAPDSGWPPVDWLFCRDGSWRPVEAGTFPLAYAVAGRVGKLRAIGNGLDFETAVAHCEAVRELADEAGL